LHAAGQLPLAQVASPADVAHLPGNLQAGLSGGLNRMNAHDHRTCYNGLLNIEGLVAFSAE
jgi:hypothetical protein